MRTSMPSPSSVVPAYVRMYVHIPSGCNCQAYIHTYIHYPPTHLCMYVCMYVILGAQPKLVTWLLVSIYTYIHIDGNERRRAEGRKERKEMVVSVSLATEPQP